VAVSVDWAQHRAHRAQVVADDGQWLGLLDADFVPIMDLPPVVSLSAPQTRNNPESLEVALRVQSAAGHVHPVVGQVIADGLGRVDAEGKLVPLTEASRLVALERPGERRLFKITHAVASGGADAPATLTVHAIDCLDLLGGYPCWSVPNSITGQWHRLAEDYAVTWSRPRDMQSLHMAAQADGFSVAGKAVEVIYRLVSESLAATYRAVGISEVSRMPTLAVPPAPSSSPEVLVRPEDASIWEVVQPVAAAAGVRVSARLWWPGDPVETAVEARWGPLSAPVVLVDIDPTEEV